MFCLCVLSGVFGVCICAEGCCGWQSCEYDGYHVCCSVQWVLCFQVCMVCILLVMGLSVCCVCLASMHVLIALWVFLSFLGGSTF